MGGIRVAIVGLGNCACSLLQGVHYYKDSEKRDLTGLLHETIGGYRPSDIEIVAAFDVDERKVGKDVSEAVFQKPNCTTVFCNDIPSMGVLVRMGKIADGISPHMREVDADSTFLPSNAAEPDANEVVKILKNSGAEILLNYLPVGSEAASRFYAECALTAGLGFINNIPVFIASDSKWAERFREAGLPIVGDDIKSQMGATIVHRVLTDLFRKRGVKLERTYQLNFGGNTDFLNMRNYSRLVSKKISKTEAVASVVGKKLADDNIHVGPSDYVPWQKDNKIGYIRMEGRLFGGVPMNLELRLSVEDSPNSAGVAIDTIRCCKLALDRGIGGPLLSVSSYFMKHPPVQHSDDVAYHMTEDFIQDLRRD